METEETDTIIKGYTTIEWLRLVAYLINCDSAFFDAGIKKYNAEDVWYCNSHGELFGVYGAIRIASHYFNSLKPDYQNKLIGIMQDEGETIVDENDFSCVGFRCIQSMYRTEDGFNRVVDKIWNKLYLNTEYNDEK